MERGTQVGSTELVPRHGIILLQQRGSRFYESQVIWINIRKRTVYVHFYIINMPLVHVTRPPYDVIIFETCNISEAELQIITHPRDHEQEILSTKAKKDNVCGLTVSGMMRKLGTL